MQQEQTSRTDQRASSISKSSTSSWKRIVSVVYAGRAKTYVVAGDVSLKLGRVNPRHKVLHIARMPSVPVWTRQGARTE